MFYTTPLQLNGRDLCFVFLCARTHPFDGTRLLSTTGALVQY